MAEAVCAKCGGTGWIIVERDGLSGAERCGCGQENRAQKLEEGAGIPPLYRDASTENFIATGSAELQKVMLDVASYTREYPVLPKPGLLFIGDPGTGKTHLAVAALRRLIARGFEGVFWDYQNLLDKIRASYDQGSGASDREAYRIALEADILVLDDLGAHRVTEWVEDIVTAIVTYRCNHKKALIVTTNLPDADTGDRLGGRNPETGRTDYRISLVDRIGIRARSRLSEMCRIVKMPAVGDYRLRK